MSRMYTFSLSLYPDRMGNPKAALEIIVGKLHNVDQVQSYQINL